MAQAATAAQFLSQPVSVSAVLPSAFFQPAVWFFQFSQLMHVGFLLVFSPYLVSPISTA